MTPGCFDEAFPNFPRLTLGTTQVLLLACSILLIATALRLVGSHIYWPAPPASWAGVKRPPAPPICPGSVITSQGLSHSELCVTARTSHSSPGSSQTQEFFILLSARESARGWSQLPLCEWGFHLVRRPQWDAGRSPGQASCGLLVEPVPPHPHPCRVGVCLFP